MKDEILEKITYDVIGCAMRVHNKLKSGFQELIYQRCLAMEFEREGIKFVREKQIEIIYDGVKVGLRRVDFYLEGGITVELKAVSDLESVHLAQAKNYLEALNIKTGLLLNFGAKSLQYKRLYNNK
ncbi:GxxExxY protein [Patescibacteria group bacterium]|nr:GxxExxY protein [Patescibacteria group bacterium]MBU1673500.1 GxxExxY protein [Patescibacteria group bacterium]MBU1963754.1 GxxExxY protein [Patescibacteria group bacterium]